MDTDRWGSTLFHVGLGSELKDKKHQITARGVIRAWQKLKNEELDEDAAREMIFEADLYVTLR